jgi:hypothetical protein
MMNATLGQPTREETYGKEKHEQPNRLRIAGTHRDIMFSLYART